MRESPELKVISKEAIPKAVNDPEPAESICLDGLIYIAVE